jgi:hypothetical protein
VEQYIKHAQIITLKKFQELEEDKLFAEKIAVATIIVGFC